MMSAAVRSVVLGAWSRGLSGAALDFDFVNGRGFNSIDRAKLTPDSILTYTAPSPKWVYNAAGLLVQSSGQLPYDYDPVTHAALGVLIEEQRTNLLTYSEQFDNAAWVKDQVTISANAIASPDGTTTADKLVESTSSSAHRAYQSITLTAASYTYSVYAKAAERTWLTLRLDTGTDQYAYFDLANGVLGSVNAAYTASITSVGGGWYRCTISRTATAVSYLPLVGLATGNNGAVYLGNGTSGIYLWGAQLEAGAFPTSYIPTVASQVTRAADQVSILTSAFAYNAAAGTMVAAADSPGISGAANIITVDDGTANERIRLLTDVLDPKIIVTDGGVAQANIDTGAIVALQPFAMSVAYALNDIAACLKGGTVGTDNVATIPTVTTLRFGSDSVGNHLNGHIKRFTYFPTRRSNAYLQVLST